MANWGIQTWDANGVPNNTGIVPVMVIGAFQVGLNQTTGSASYNVPAGFKLAALTSSVVIDPYTPTRRRISVNGGILTISDATNDYSAGTTTAYSTWIIVYLVKA